MNQLQYKNKIIKKYNTLKTNTNKELTKFTEKFELDNADLIKAEIEIAKLQQIVKDKNLEKYMYPISLRGVKYKNKSLKLKIDTYKLRINKVDSILTYLETCQDQNNLEILDHIIKSRYMFEYSNQYWSQEFKYFSIFSNNLINLNINFSYTNDYINLILNINDIEFVLSKIYMPNNVNQSDYYKVILYELISSPQSYNGSQSKKDIFFKMSEDTQANLILKILELIPQSNNLDKILNILTPNTKPYNVIAKYQVFK